ncbi:MAG: glycosyltransferase [Candidatus Marinimicrobia bacterium]|nr:glycosyltransferase [Candidatus Neomarinimicrobiota bacterium]MBL7109957.1 glycosyltransferase [Candidatus Neomarinimicrobiota bacterium]
MILLKVITKTKVIYDNHEDYPSYLMVKKSIPIWIRRLVKVSYKFFFKISESVFDFIFYADPFTSGFDPAKQKQAIIYNYPIVSKYPQKEKKYDLIFPGSVDLDVCQRLMKIAEEFDKKYSHKIKFLIIGRDVSSENKHLIQSITLKLQNVELIFMEDMPFKSVQEYIAESKIGLLPLPNIEKFRKNIPTKLFEYMLHSIPMLASDLPPISCFLEKTDGNFVITENDYQNSYIEKISEILDHYPEYRKKCNLNFQILEQQWNWDRTEKQKLVKIINKMLM